jgi:hypothetical protein
VSVRAAAALCIVVLLSGCAARRAGDPSAREPAADEPAAPSFEPIVFPHARPEGAPGGDGEALRALRPVSEDAAGWEEKWALAQRYAATGYDDEALAVVDAALAGEPPAEWEARLRGVRDAVRMRRAEELLRIQARGVRDYVPFGTDVDWVVRLRNVSSEDVVLASPGTASGPGATVLSPSALVLEIVRRDVDIYASELRRAWTQTFYLQEPGGPELRIPPGGVHEVRMRIPAEEAGGPLSGLRMLEVTGTFRPSRLRAGGSEGADRLRVRPGRVVALPDNHEPLAREPLRSMERAVGAVAPTHLLVAAEFVSRADRPRAIETLAGALAEGDPALRTASLGALGLLAERAAGTRASGFVGPLLAAWERAPARADAIAEGLRLVTGMPWAADLRLWKDWVRRHPDARVEVPAVAAPLEGS